MSSATSDGQLLWRMDDSAIVADHPRFCDDSKALQYRIEPEDDDGWWVVTFDGKRLYVGRLAECMRYAEGDAI